ncbi:hypothetical protein FD725_07120 [Nostoc sp. TCL26-01]|nr:hypothetical protein FD725_07120 [Nostoc sp. TCL26-01]
MALIVNTPVFAIDNPQISNGLLPREPNFFSQGREQFEAEIRLLFHKSLMSPSSILKGIPDTIKTQEQLLPLENPRSSPVDTNKSELNQIVDHREN